VEKDKADRRVCPVCNRPFFLSTPTDALHLRCPRCAAPTKAISGHSGLWVTEEGVIVGFSCTRCGFEVAAIDKDECPSCFARVHGTTSYSAAWHEDKKQYHLQLAFRFTDWNSQKEALLIERCSDS
jgi:DNA-directed RNA polymerase subunit RPC12/RpoP